MGPPLVSRETELAELVEATTYGSGAVLSGPAGVGKTALANAIAKHVTTKGGRVEWVVATDASRSIPFGALSALLPGDVDERHPALVLGAIIRRQRELDERKLGLIVVDDAHLLDDHSAATLLGLVTAGAGRVVATVRSGEAAPDAVGALWKDGFLARCEVGPFDRAATAHFAEACLGGEVAAGTASLLWQHTQGNALFLSELIRQARADNRLADEHGVWMWRGDMTVPPRLADLLDRRFDRLGPAAVDALGALVLGEPLSLSMLTDVVSIDGIAELEDRDIVGTTERAGEVWYRFAHPMLAVAAARRITSTQRRRLADALVNAPNASVDVVRRALWLLDSSGTPDVELLLAAARAVFLTRPGLARRLAERAVRHDTTPRAALMVADACAELGDIDAARRAQAEAATKISTDADALFVRINHVSLTAFSDRRPDIALELLAEVRADLPEEYGPDIDSMAAQITVFSARPADALVLAERVLAESPPRACRIRASSVRVIALSMVDRTLEAMAASEALLADVAAGPTSPYAQGIAHIAALLARFANSPTQLAPATDPSGRWPVPASGSDLTPQSEAVFYPLFEGARRLLEGRVDQAIAPLREAVAQQRVGEGLLRSEAVALLVVALASTGQVEKARRLLAEAPPDRVAIYSGLRPWAESAVHAAEGRSTAVGLAFEAYEQAREAGSPISAVAYLDTAARYGAATPAADVLEAWGSGFEAAISQARAMSIRARANRDSKALLEAAEFNAAAGLCGDALGLAELAAAGFGSDRSGALARAKSLAAEMRVRLERPESAAGPVVPLTRREMEVAGLAAKGMSDRDISEVLFLSVRTVQNHLATIYRKLDISSRRGLRDALEPRGTSDR